MRTVQRNQIADSAINTDKLNDAAVTTSKLADASVSGAKLTPGLLQPYSAVRQTVQYGPRDANQQPNWLLRSSSTLIVTYAFGEDAIVSASQGFGNNSERLGVLANGATALEWDYTGASINTTYFMYVDVAEDGTLTAGKTSVAPIYTRSNVSFADYAATRNIFDIDTMTMWAGNGVTAVKKWRVFVGEVTTDGAGLVPSAAGSVITYAYNGRATNYNTRTNPLPTASAITLTHNIGTKPESLKLKLLCRTNEDTFVVGDIITDFTGYNGTTYHVPSITHTSRNAAKTRIHTSYHATEPGASALNTLTAGSWDLFFEAERGW